MLSRTQAGPGRAVKQEQEEISPNHAQRLNLISVHPFFYCFLFFPTFVHALLVAALGEGVGDGVGGLAQNLLRPHHSRRGRRLIVGIVGVNFDVFVVIVVLAVDVAKRITKDATI